MIHAIYTHFCSSKIDRLISSNFTIAQLLRASNFKLPPARESRYDCAREFAWWGSPRLVRGKYERSERVSRRTIAQEMQASRPVNKRIELRTRVKRLGPQMRLNGLAWPTSVHEGKKKKTKKKKKKKRRAGLEAEGGKNDKTMDGDNKVAQLAAKRK